MSTPTLGRVVNFTTATGNVVTAQVICTEKSYSPGRYVNVITPEARRNALTGESGPAYDNRGSAVAADVLDVEGDRWVPSPVPQPKPDTVHLKVTAPNGRIYAEFNVEEDWELDVDHPADTPGTPGTWHYPPHVSDEDADGDV